MKNLSATYKGLITGTLMILVSIGIYSRQGNFQNNLQYITYLIYIAGIVWTLNDYRKSETENKTFKAYFSQGFKCFIVVTLLMVAFTWIFMKMNPGMTEQMARQTEIELIKTGNKTPQEITDAVANAKKYFIPMLTSIAIFGYLLIGSVITLIAALIFSGGRMKGSNA